MDGSRQVQRVIPVSAVVLRDENGAVLTVRKRGTDQFMFPGGKIEPGETAVAAAVREIAEELATELDPTRLQLLGTFSARAANEPDWDVEATVYTYPLIPITGPAHEIEELRWQLIDEYQHSSDLPPLLVDHVFPLLRAGGKCR